MTNIITRLRDMTRDMSKDNQRIIAEAANEISHLRSENRKLTERVDELTNELDYWTNR